MDQQSRIRRLLLCFSSDEEHPDSSYNTLNIPKDTQRQDEPLKQASNHLDGDSQQHNLSNNFSQKEQKLQFSDSQIPESNTIKKQKNQINPLYDNKSSHAYPRQTTKKYQIKKSKVRHQPTTQEFIAAQKFKINSTKNFIDSKILASQKVYTFDGLEVYFPYEAYNVQLTYMQKVIESLKNSKHALLQSPTGTGKTLCLLASVLSWVYSQKKKDAHFKVIYLSRTHSQLAQIQKQLRATCFRPTMTLVGSRQHFCIKSQLNQLKGRQKMQACSKGVQLKIRSDTGEANWEKQQPQQKKKHRQTLCQFYTDRSRTIEIGTTYYSNKIIERQTFKNEALEKHFCPYYYAMQMEQYCDLFLMPYNYILDIDLLPRFASMISNSILIIDEAHNVSEASCEGRSYQVLSSNIKGAEAEITKIMFHPNVSKEIKSIRNMNKKQLNKIQKFISDIQATINDYLFRIPFEDAPIEKDKLYYNYEQKTRTKVIDTKQLGLAIYELIAGTMGFNQRQKFLQNDVQHTRMIVKLGSQIEQRATQISNVIECLKEAPDGIFHNIQKVIAFFRKATALLVKSLNQVSFINNQINHYRLLIKVNFDQYSKIQDYTFQLRCLVPWLTFSSIQQCGPRSIIFTSGTMSPLHLWESQLKIKAPIKLVNDHVISSGQVRLNIIPKSCNDVNFNFGYQNLKQDSDAIYRELVFTLLQICTKIPNGILVICPNFKTLTSIQFAIRINNLQHKFEQTKKIVYQERSNQIYIDHFKEYSKKGAILFCVCRGKASQGIDFPDHTCRAVVFVGVPYPNISDPIIKERKQHFRDLSQQNLISGVSYLSFEQWYFNSTIRAINQGLGRVIRHKNDYGMLFLLDERYTQTKFDKGLPKWARSTSVDIWKKITQQKIQGVEQFYRGNSKRFDTEIVAQSQDISPSTVMKQKNKPEAMSQISKKKLFNFIHRKDCS